MTYFLLVENEQRGPYNESQLKEMLLSGLLPNTALFWSDGMSEWKPLSDFRIGNDIPFLQSPSNHSLKVGKHKIWKIAGAIVVAMSLVLLGALMFSDYKPNDYATSDTDGIHAKLDQAYIQLRLLQEGYEALRQAIAFQRGDDDEVVGSMDADAGIAKMYSVSAKIKTLPVTRERLYLIFNQLAKEASTWNGDPAIKTLLTALATISESDLENPSRVLIVREQLQNIFKQMGLRPPE